jgi:stage II sporulation protein E
MREIELLGVSASSIFVSLASLVVSKRFGPLRALAVGFTATLGLSASHAVSFALMGLSSGILFGFGTAAGLVGGGAALSLWSSYSDGLFGFLSTLPEYLIAAVLSIPLVKSISAEKSESESRESTREAEEMVGSCALAYRTKHSPSLDALGAALSSVALLVRDEREEHTPSLADYRVLVRTVLSERCRLCDGAPLCTEHKIPEEIVAEDRIAARLFSGERCRAEDVNTATAFCQHAGEVAGMINERAAALEREKYRRDKSASSEELELVARLLCEARERDREELVLNSEDTEKCSSALARLGLSTAVIRVFGEARRHVILALEDEVGDKITSNELHAALRSALGAPLRSPEYFRRGKMTLMECDLEKKYRVEYSTATAAGRGNKVSGDTAAGFVSDSGYFYSLISDGEGTGESARDASLFVLELLRKILNLGISTESVLYTLNMLLLQRREECSATVDLFEFDLHTGEATFIKSGAAPSFVKRGDSVFRIRSKTAPIGLMQSIDTEKIRAEILPGDTVIMLSDGIASSPEEAPWLVEMLGRSTRRSTRDLSELILAEARRRSSSDDDMTVSVLRIVAEVDGA